MLRGKRVILRAIERDDLKRMHELGQEVDLVNLATGAWQPFSLAAYEKRFERDLEDRERSSFAIDVEDVMIGMIGLHNIMRRDGIAALGISIYSREHLGKGYGRDAIEVFLDWAFRIQNYRRIWLDTVATNERAVRAYLACGFVEEGRLRQHYYLEGQYVDAVMMGILRSEWEARQPS